MADEKRALNLARIYFGSWRKESNLAGINFSGLEKDLDLAERNFGSFAKAGNKFNLSLLQSNPALLVVKEIYSIMQKKSQNVL